MSGHEYDFEPIRGLPEKLPAGERILWQASPDWKALAWQAYRLRAVAAYFGLLLAWRIADAVSAGHSIPRSLLATTWLLMLAGVALGVLVLLAWLGARNTVYTLTNRRIVIRHGIALPMTVNIPFAVIESANMKAHANGFGEIALTLAREQRIGYLLTWPHVRAWHFTRPQPAMRTLPTASRVAQLLAAALRSMPRESSPDLLPPTTAAQPLRPSLDTHVRPRTDVAA